MNLSAQDHINLQVGVTAHRDLSLANIDDVTLQVREFFHTLQESVSDLPLTLLTPLAVGGDTLVARIALEMGIALLIPLPMPQALYEQDFDDADSLAEFRELCAQGEVLELPPVDAVDEATLLISAEARALQYAQLGTFVSSQCQILLALWDGQPSVDIGGTNSVVNYHLHGSIPGYTAEEDIPDFLNENENDLVYHIHCSRASVLGPATPPIWLNRNGVLKCESIPEPYLTAFERMAAFSKDIGNYRSDIESNSDSLLRGSSIPEDPQLNVIDSLYSAADWLAIHFQKRVTFHLATTHWLALLMGFSFILYSEFENMAVLLPGFLALFFVALVTNYLASVRQWHRKYLDYRTLAEGLRVQLYWSLAGIEGREGAGVAYDNLVQKQDVELGWVRHIMRNGGSRIRLSKKPGSGGIQLAIDHWIGGYEGQRGQLDYFQAASARRGKLVRHTDYVARIALWIGISMAILLLWVGESSSDGTRTFLLILMGLLPLAAGVRETYTYKKADKELSKQYQFMLHTFTLARDEVDRCADPQKRMEILKVLGEACLEEHSEWVMIHRARPLEHSGLQT